MPFGPGGPPASLPSPSSPEGGRCPFHLGRVLTVAGLAIGTLAALAAARFAAGMLVNVSASDPLTFACAAAFLGLVAALASCLPALRAMRVDPVVALRNE